MPQNLRVQTHFQILKSKGKDDRGPRADSVSKDTHATTSRQLAIDALCVFLFRRSLGRRGGAEITVVEEGGGWALVKIGCGFEKRSEGVVLEKLNQVIKLAVGRIARTNL